MAPSSATLGGCLVPRHSSCPGTRRSLLLPRLETEEGHGDPNAQVTGSSRAKLRRWAPFYMWLAMCLRLERKTPTVCQVLCKSLDDITFHFIPERYLFTGETGAQTAWEVTGRCARWPGLCPASVSATCPGSTTRQLHNGTRYVQEIPLRLGEAGHSQQVFRSPGTGMRALDVQGGSKARAPPGRPAVGRCTPGHRLPACSHGSLHLFLPRQTWF